jgi:hypothetical protein
LVITSRHCERVAKSVARSSGAAFEYVAAAGSGVFGAAIPAPAAIRMSDANLNLNAAIAATGSLLTGPVRPHLPDATRP